MGDTPKASPTTERATGFAGVLEVHVVEAKELPGTKKAKEDKLSPYVELRLASKEKDKQSTLAAKGPTYRWGLMMNFFVFNLEDELIVTVKEKQTFSDAHRGTCRIAIGTLIESQLADMWLPLNASPKKDAILGGRLHLEITLKPADAGAIAATPKSKRKTMMLQSTGSSASLTSVGSIKIDDIGDINIVAPEGEFPITADPRGPTPYSFNPGNGQFEIPQMNFSGFFVLDRDIQEV